MFNSGQLHINGIAGTNTDTHKLQPGNQKYGSQMHASQASPQRHHQSQQRHFRDSGTSANSHQQHFPFGGQSTSLGSAFSNVRSLKSLDPPLDSDLKVSASWQAQLQRATESRNGVNLPHRHCKRSDAVQLISKTSDDTAADEEGAEDQPNITSSETGQRQDWHALDFSGQGLRIISRTVFSQFKFLRALFLDHNNLDHLDPAIGQLSLLAELDLSSNQIEIIPPETGMLVHLRQLLMFDNHIETLPMELGHLFRLETLGIEGNPLDPYFKETISQSGTEALIKRLRDDHLSPSKPRSRPWIPVGDAGNFSAVSIISYNILCEKYATTSQYGYTPARALAWENRREHIVNEVIERDADVLCLQEIDRGGFQDIFQPRLSLRDYKGLFYPKTRAKNMNEKEALSVDGCAIFYKAQKFLCHDKMLIDLATTAINRPDMKSENDIFNRVMPRDNIALVALLEHRETGQNMMVANAHIFWDPAFADVKLVQVAILLEEISRKSVEWTGRQSSTGSVHKTKDGGRAHRGPSTKPSHLPSHTQDAEIPLVICGDFNSAVGTGVYDLITNGELPGNHADFESRAYGKFTKDGMHHPFKLQSAYACIGELRFTNYTPNFAGVLDYIWYSPDFMQVTGLLGDVDEEDLRRIPGFPHLHFPSDHLALHASFVLRSKPTIGDQ